MPLRRGREPLVSGVPELEVGLELLFYVCELLVVLRGNDTVFTREARGRSCGRVDAIDAKLTDAESAPSPPARRAVRAR